MADLSLGGLAAVFASAAKEVASAEYEALDKAAVIVEKAAKDAIGTYTFGWDPLAPSTLARKAADTPLLETGELRDSIEHTVSGRSAYVGSNSDKAVWQTYGTSRGIPPRPFMVPALQQNEAKVVVTVGETVFTRTFGR